MRRGFTLLEALVGVLILGMLVVGLAGGARFGAGAAIRQGRMSDRDGDLDAIDRLLRQIVATADPAAPLLGTAGTLSLVAELPGRTGPSAVALGIDGRGRLLLRATPKPPGLPLRPIPATQTELLAGVAGITFSYYAPPDAAGAPGHWQDAWSGTALPQLVRLRIAFADTAGPRWPDIVAAPRRAR